MFFRVNDDEHDNIDKVVEVLRMWGIVLHDTTSPRRWTLSCDATNEVAIQKVKAMKKWFLPLQNMVIVQDEKMLEDFVCSLPYFIRQFLHTQDKQVTVIYPYANYLAPSVANLDGSVPVRIIPSIDTPPIQMSRHVLRLLGKPVFVTTCTVGEWQTPLIYEDIEDHIKAGVELVSPLLFGVDETWDFSMLIKYDHYGHIAVIRK